MKLATKFLIKVENDKSLQFKTKLTILNSKTGFHDSKMFGNFSIFSSKTDLVCKILFAVLGLFGRVLAVRHSKCADMKLFKTPSEQ